jgi:ADP-ribosyl-[dinitrogen reductase] hydrolase
LLVHDYSDDEKRALSPWWEAVASIPVAPAAPALRRTGSRVRGMLLGLAVGDALGNTSEGLSPAERYKLFGRTLGDRAGDIRDYLPNRREGGAAVGLPSDDTQLTFWTVESLLRRGGWDPEDVARTFTRQDRIYGIGATVTAFLMAYRFGGKLWYQAGQPSAGNGALMRIAPLLLPHLSEQAGGLWPDVVAATVLTHRDEAAVAASVGLVGLLAECVAREGEATPSPAWWHETFLKYARTVETGIHYGAPAPGGGFQGTLCERVEQLVGPALTTDTGVREAAAAWSSGSYLLETVPCVLLVLARHGDEPEEAIVRAINDTRDSDTIGAIVGAVLGALSGDRVFPVRWTDGLLGRTREADDGQVQRLADKAVETFVG